MKTLATQQEFEALWFHKAEEVATPEGLRTTDNGWIVYFTASWCGPCKKLQCDELDAAAEERGLTIFKCDETVNNYTAGYCGIRSFPTFVFFQPKKIAAKIQSNQTDVVQTWIRSLS